MIEAYRLISEKTDYPLHLGVTEAGTLVQAAIKSAIGIGTLLYDGIGDTIRVSVTGNPVPEIGVAYGILRALNIRMVGPDIISCPTCGRCEIDLAGLAERVERELQGMKTHLKIALMGCVVNGPGEAAEADIGIAGGRGGGMLFKKGKIVRKIREEEFLPVLLEEIRTMTDDAGPADDDSSTMTSLPFTDNKEDSMRYSEMFLPTGREVPSDAELISHQLMIRAGLMRKLTSGVYSYLPLGYRVIRKVEQIVREEMNRAGAQEVFLPMVQPAELWQESGDGSITARNCSASAIAMTGSTASGRPTRR